MFESRSLKKILVIIALSLILISGIVGGIFVYRPPVLIVSDLSFYALYGSDRLRQRQREISAALFRRVIPVTVFEHAGPDHIAMAVADASRRPWAALFPFRYHEGARLYKMNNPEVTVVVIGGRNPKPPGLEDTGIIYVRTDVAKDLYRAGVSAAFFAGEQDIIIFDDEFFPEDNRASLRELLESRDFAGELEFRTQHMHIHSFDEIGSIIITGPASRSLDENIDTPVILFSWLDPILTPGTVKLIFDDSPWALAPEALRSKSEGEVLLPSMPIPVSDRITERRDFRKLGEIIRENF